MADNEKKIGLTRRGFIKGVTFGAGAAAAGTGLLGGWPSNVAMAGSKGTDLPGTKPVPPAAVPAVWDHKTDILVLGAGGAGLSAAVTAREKGAKVMVIEKNAFCGGDTSVAMMYFSNTMDTKFQKKLGMKPVPVTQAFAQATAAFDYRNNAEVGRTLIERNTETADWLEEMGAVYDPGSVAGLPPGFVLTNVDPEHPEEGFYRWWPYNAKGFTKLLEKRARTLGVKFLLETPATALVTASGKVLGVEGRTKAGEKIYIKSKVTILCTGGFGASTDMLKKYISPEMFDGIAHYIGFPGATGDGIKIAQGVGADVEGMDNIEIWDGGPTDVGQGPMAFYNAATQLVRQKSLSVNMLGKRFMDESTSYTRGTVPFKAQAYQTIRQKDQTSFTIHDSETVKKDFIIKRFEAMICEYPCRWYEKDFKRWVKEGVIMKADTIEDLARLMDVDPVALKETVDLYNGYSLKGQDPEFFKPAKYLIPIKTPPFYAVKQKGGSLFNTFGGLVTNSKFQVLGKDWKVIPGLRVAGENAAYCATIGNALTSGRVAGESAAAEALGI